MLKMSINGILNVNKPEGKTSFQVVALLRRMVGETRVGHAGTLDPAATGVLPVCLGQATRIVQFLTDTDKAYLAEIELGVTTDTFDREGRVTCRLDTSGITVTQIEEALATFQGFIEQVPPRFSALKYQGKRYYELARAGILIEPKPRKIRITSIELVDLQPPFITISLECSKGTYVRSLAHDLGQCLGCGAHLKNLTRTRCGPFYIEDALSMSEIQDACQRGTWRDILYPVDTPLLSWSAVIVDKRDELEIRNGCSISLSEGVSHAGKYCRAYSPDGDFIAILRFISDKRLWHPEKVFSP